jgi:hypothetical protein
MSTNTFKEEKLKVAHSLKSFGGSFHQTLGKLLIQADEPHSQKLKQAFTDDWDKYLNMYQFIDGKKTHLNP